MSIDNELMRSMKRCAYILRHHCIYNESQNRLVMLINHFGPISQKELLSKMNIQPGSLSELVSKVEAAGFIEKKQSENDKRSHLLHITEKGSEMAKEFEKQQDEMTEQLFAVLDDEQKESLLSNLSFLLEHWQGIQHKE